MYCRVVLLCLWRRTRLVNDAAGKGARAGSQLTHYWLGKEKNGLSWLLFALVGSMQMLKELLREVDGQVMRLLYVCRRASLGTIVYTDSPESGATIDTNSQPRPFPFFLMGNVPSRRLVVYVVICKLGS